MSVKIHSSEITCYDPKMQVMFMWFTTLLNKQIKDHKMQSERLYLLRIKVDPHMTILWHHHEYCNGTYTILMMCRSKSCSIVLNIMFIQCVSTLLYSTYIIPERYPASINYRLNVLIPLINFIILYKLFILNL